MITAGIKEVKNNLSRYLARVKVGEEILITERGKPVARIVKENQGNRSIRAALGPLIKKGLIALPSQRINKEHLSPVKAPGKLVSEMVIEDRR
jgi:antitoxin (DNA-binding transcriptional repressor) of toxin-antitoxin stability system